MARGGAGRRKKQTKQQDADSEDGEPKFAVGRFHAGFLGFVVGAGGAAVYASDWLDDPGLFLPIALGGGVIGGVLAFFIGDKVWSTLSDWI